MPQTRLLIDDVLQLARLEQELAYSEHASVKGETPASRNWATYRIPRVERAIAELKAKAGI